MDREEAQRMVDAILEDVVDDLGLRQAFENIDGHVRTALRETLTILVVAYGNGLSARARRARSRRSQAR